MSFPPQVKEEALVACGRHCCLCHKFCGIKIEIHHIQERSEGGDDSFDNAIPLCFDCHADMRSYDRKHPKGTKYTRKELKRHRQNWYDKVAGNLGLLNREEAIKTDLQVYQVLVRVLPWDGTISFVRTNNFAGFSFNTKRLDDFHEFKHNCKNPAFEFLDPDLEGLRVTLYEKIDSFTAVIATETFPTSGGLNAVPEEWEHEQSDRFNRVVKLLHETAQEIVQTYEDLSRLATRKLGVLPDSMVNQ